MAFAHDPTNPANMTLEGRFSEVAALLAEGVVRLWRGAAVPAVSAGVFPVKNPLVSADDCLEVPSETSPHGHRG